METWLPIAIVRYFLLMGGPTSERCDGHARAMEDSIQRGQGRFGTLHHPLGAAAQSRLRVSLVRARVGPTSRCRQPPTLNAVDFAATAHSR